MSENVFPSVKLDGIGMVAKAIIQAMGDNKILVFKAGMGAGKTTFIKELCLQLDIIDPVTSPTFSIVNEYHSVSGPRIYHFDLYRLKDLEEILATGFEEYLDSNCYCFIEWPDLVLPLLENPAILKINQEPDGTRTYQFMN